MAEEKKKESTEVIEVVKPNNNGTKSSLLILLVVANMLVVLFTGFMIYLGKKQENKKVGIDKIVESEHKLQTEEALKKEEFVNNIVPLETFLVNLAGTRGRKIAKVNIELEVAGEMIHKEIEKREAQIRDRINLILSSKTYENVATKEGKEYLRAEIRDTVNSFLKKGQIREVYFTEFIYN